MLGRAGVEPFVPKQAQFFTTLHRMEPLIVVTGASRGIGQDICRLLLDSTSYHVLAVARDLSRLDELVSMAPSRVVPYACDLTDPQQLQRFCSDLEERSNLRGLVSCCAAFGYRTMLGMLSDVGIGE